jgi:4-amino-4-deoxy-L-arabinose transferase-like glycosyltransferase
MLVALSAGIFVVMALWLTRSGSALTPDSIDYAEAARSLVRGEGATINRIMFHTGLFPRIRHPLEVHGILQTLLISGLFATGGPVPGLVRVPSMVFLGCLFVTVYLVGRRQFGSLAGLVAACVLFGRQDLLFWSVVGADDIAFALFSLAALSFFMTGTQEPKLRRFVMAGICAGLAWLDKASGVALVAAFAIGLLVSRTARSGVSWRSLLAVIAPSVIVFGLYVLRNLQAYGRPGSPYTAVEWIGRDHFPSYFALYEHVPSVRDVVARIGVAGIGRSIVYQLSLLGRITLIDVALLAVVPAVVALRRRNGAFCVFGLAFTASLVFLTCVIHHVEYRYLSPLIALGAVGIGGIVDGIEGWVRGRFPGRARALRAAALCLLAGYGLFSGVRRYRELVDMGAAMKRPDECGRAAYVISRVVPKDEAVLTTNAWFVSWNAERAAVGAPTNGEDAILTVARHYDVRWAMTGKLVPGAVDLAGALASRRLTAALRPELVDFGQQCNVYRLHRVDK